MSTQFMSDNSLSELVAKIKSGFMPIKNVFTEQGESSADLDTYTSSGIYYISGYGVENEPGNCKRGTLIVFKPANNLQIWIDRDFDLTYGDCLVYSRYYSALYGWDGWFQFVSNRDMAGKLDSSDFTLSNITGTLSIAKGGTGATDQSTALANLAYNTVVSGDSTDLNFYTTQTINCFTSTVPAVTNIPTGSSGVGMLAVVTSDRTDLYQVWFEMSGGKTDMYMRTRISGTWSSWGKVYNTNDDSGFINPSLAGVGSEVSHCFVSKKAGFVNVTGYVRAVPTSTTASTVTTATVPEGYRPTQDAVTSFCVNESVTPNTLHAVQITTNGNINIRNVVKTTAANQVFRLNITYPSDF